MRIARAQRHAMLADVEASWPPGRLVDGAVADAHLRTEREQPRHCLGTLGKRHHVFNRRKLKCNDLLSESLKHRVISESQVGKESSTINSHKL